MTKVPDGLAWRKSRASATGNCVEVAARDDLVFVRDTKDRESALLTFTTAEWEAFLVGVQRQEFDYRTLCEPLAETTSVEDITAEPA